MIFVEEIEDEEQRGVPRSNFFAMHGEETKVMSTMAIETSLR